MDKVIPGTNKPFLKENAFEAYKELIALTDGLSLSQVCTISHLDPAVIQNWVKRGYVSHPTKKKYHEKQLARILMINSLRGAMKIEDIARLMSLINGDVEDESDDLISEEELYHLFTKVIYHLENYEDIDRAIKKITKNKSKNDEKLELALKVMCNAYIASEHRKNSLISLRKLEKTK